MKLLKIEIIGFKSFADRIVLPFSEGITCVVGPNGCGKSNISDAFRWVLGESAKSMRAAKTTEVIFNGTTQRKALNFAEVTITLDNSDGSLAIDYTEVSITRRLYRSGESEYYINKQPVRQKDVHVLFLDSGLGRDAYSNFEQGKMDHVVNSSPYDRRIIFEGAAGILGFLHNKREALRKLEQSELNINRAKDIHAEVGKQIVVLEEQAEKARLFKEGKSRLDHLEKGLFLARWELLQKKKEGQKKREEETRQRGDAENKTLAEMIAGLQKAKEEFRQAEQVMRSRSEEVFQTRGDKEIKTKEKQAQQENLKEALAKEKRWQQELDGMVDKRKQRRTESQQLKKQQGELEAEIKVKEKELKTLHGKVHNFEGELNKLREQQQAIQKELIQFIQQEKQAESELKQASIRLENGQERLNQLTEKTDKISAQIKELEASHKEKRSQSQELSNEIDTMKTALRELETLEADLLRDEGELQKEAEILHKELTEWRARQTVLQRMQDEKEGFSSGSKKLLQEASQPKSLLHSKLKPLYELIQVGQGAEASAMRPYMQTLTVADWKDWALVTEFARKNKLKDFSLLCLESIGSPTPKALAAHFLTQLETVSDLDNAWKAKKGNSALEVWTEEGAFIDRRCVVFFSPQGEQNIFVRETELKTLAKKLADGEAQRKTLSDKIAEMKRKRGELTTNRIEKDKTIRKTEMRLIEVNFSLQNQTGNIERLKKESAQYAQESSQLQATLSGLKDSLKTLQKRYEESKAKAAEKQSKTAEVHADLDKQAAAFKGEQSLLQSREADYHKLAEELRRNAHALHVLEVKDIESDQQEKRLAEEITSNREAQERYKVRSADYDKLLIEADELLAKVVAACSSHEKELARQRQAMEQVEAKIHDQRGKIKKSEEELYQIGIQDAQAAASSESLETELQERFNLDIPGLRALKITLDKPIDQSERYLRQLRQELEAAGDINMTSIEEYDRQKERYSFLNGQIDDLNTSKQELIAIISKLDTDSRKIFQETFEKVRDNFKKNFKILFNGGEADLAFIDSNDVLEAGIEIIAKPPGKQMRSINLLSGGEKCLTAMALLFAIFEVRPAPYCILDEIDAPLDDTNVERFVNVLKQFIDRCQFIIITHNKRTMAIADILYGVSMEEKGISKILTLEFSPVSQ